jgi:hypothetical protein
MTLEISQKTQQLLQVEAARQHTSPEQLAELLIKIGLLVKKRDLSHLAGTWTEEEYREFEELVAPLNEVVEEQEILELKIRLENSRGFDAFSGLWTQQEADEFAVNTKAFSQIDKEIWRETNPA